MGPVKRLLKNASRPHEPLRPRNPNSCRPRNPSTCCVAPLTLLRVQLRAQVPPQLERALVVLVVHGRLRGVTGCLPLAWRHALTLKVAWYCPQPVRSARDAISA